MALPQQQQQQQQQRQGFSFDLDTRRGDPYKRNFVFTLPKWEGWNVFSSQDPSLPSGSFLLIEHFDVTSAGACGQPYVMMHDDGRMVGQRTTYIQNAAVSKPPWFPSWAEWSKLVHGVCGFDSFERKTVTGEIEALNEERFFLSEFYMTLSELVRSHEDDRSPYKFRRWQSQVEAQIPPGVLERIIRRNSIMECLKKRYLECPLIKTRSDHVIMDLCLHMPALTRDQDNDANAPMHVAVTVSGKRISTACSPSKCSSDLQPIEKIQEILLLPVGSGVPFEEIFRRFPIRFHRDMIVFR